MDIVCDGPGPHIPLSGIIGQTQHRLIGARCTAAVCALPAEYDRVSALEKALLTKAVITSEDLAAAKR